MRLSAADIMDAYRQRLRYDCAMARFLNQESWDRARFIAFWGIQPHVKRGKLKNFSELISFPWDEGYKKPKVDQAEEMQRVREFWAKMDK